MPADTFSAGRRRGDIKVEQEYAEVPPRAERSTIASRVDTGHHLADVIASLTEAELSQLPSSTAKILIPALIALESVVLKELERLHDLAVNQDLRLEILEQRQLQEKEILEAANTIREEQYLKQRQEQKDALQKQEGLKTRGSSNTGSQPAGVDVINGGERSVGDVLNLDTVSLNTSLLLAGGEDGSGSGDESLSAAVHSALMTTFDTTTASPATTTANLTRNSDSAIINHIYEIYSSITSMEHKVMELGTSLTHVSSEVYRQRASFVRLEDKVEEIRRDQRNLVMRSTMHGFKITDMEQFKGQAELVLRTAESSLKQFQTKLEAFKDRVTQQQDDMDSIRNTFARLDQSSVELRSADAYKAHDIQELKRGTQQLEGRLSGLYHSLDQYIGNVRWDVKTYLDHLCSNNNLNCR